MRITLDRHVRSRLKRLVGTGLWGNTEEQVAAALIRDALLRLMATPGFKDLLLPVEQATGARPKAGLNMPGSLGAVEHATPAGKVGPS